VAEKYLEAAELMAEEPEAAAGHVVVSVAVLAGIAAGDAICCASLRERYRGTDHFEAVRLLARTDRDLSDELAKLIRLKPTSHYGSSFVTADNRRQAMRAASKLVRRARQVTAGPAAYAGVRGRGRHGAREERARPLVSRRDDHEWPCLSAYPAEAHIGQMRCPPASARHSRPRRWAAARLRIPGAMGMPGSAASRTMIGPSTHPAFDRPDCVGRRAIDTEPGLTLTFRTSRRRYTPPLQESLAAV
jgi:hypothetical protein